MKIVCPNCRVPVAAEDVDLGTGLAKCRTCNNVFRFDTDPELAASPAKQRPPVEKPRSIVIVDANGELTVNYRWFSPKYIFMTIFCIFWDGFLVFWYAIALGTRNPIMILFPILHVLAGIFITYVTIAGYVNTTTLQINDRRLRVQHHPLPFGRVLELSVGDVKQLFCDETVTRGRSGYSYSYNLNALLQNGTRKKVLANLDNTDLPLYLERYCEAWMRITDQPVAGELAR
ncbi:MAG TPA: hypothetical protein VF771_08120 [Longimicrobiaceae bacterium]